MPIALPTCPYPNDYQVMVRDFGSTLTPFLGGPEQRINRLGTRFGLKLDMPALEAAEGMAYLSALVRGKQSGVTLPWPLLDFDPGNPGTPLVASSTTAGTTIALKGLTPGYTIKDGQFFSLIHGARRYVYMFAGDRTANGSGTVSADIFPLLRTPLTVNDVVEIAQPMIEGLVPDDISWMIGLDNAREFSFSIMEAA